LLLLSKREIERAETGAKPLVGGQGRMKLNVFL